MKLAEITRLVKNILDFLEEISAKVSLNQSSINSEKEFAIDLETLSQDSLSVLAKSLLEEIKQDSQSALKGLTIQSSSYGGFYVPYVWWNNEKIDDSRYPHRPLSEIVKIKFAIQELVEKDILILHSGNPDSIAWYVLQDSAELIANTLAPSLLEEIKQDTRSELSGNPDSIAWYVLQDSAELIANTLAPSLLEEIKQDTRSKLKGLTLFSVDDYENRGYYLPYFYERGEVSIPQNNLVEIKLAVQKLVDDDILRYYDKRGKITRYVLNE